MATFKLGSGADELEFGVDGSVAKGGVPFGNWRTTRENAIEVKAQDGSVQAFDVNWSFNPQNQLLLLKGTTEIFNFCTDRDLTPGYELHRSVLKFTPHRLAGFAFELRGEWDLSEAHDLTFTVNGKISTLRGFISDSEGKSRFMFIFVDKTRPTLLHRIRFEGAWAANPEQEGGLLFTYVREDDSIDVFTLPGTVTINKTTNQLRYEYTKNGKKSIEFEGTLVISPDLVVTYAVSRQTTGTGETLVNESEIRFGAVFAKQDFKGNLELNLKKRDGSVSDVTLTIAGTFTAVRGETALAVGFRFEQIRAGQRVTTTFALAGQLKFKNNTTVQWAFTTSNTTTRTIDLKIGADIKLGAATGDVALDLQTSGGQIQGVKFLLGINF